MVLFGNRYFAKAGLWLLFRASAEEAEVSGLTIPWIPERELTTPAALHRALAPAWDSFVAQRHSAGLVGPKDEGKPQPPLSKEEAAMQFDRVQRGQVDSARLLLVFGMVPAAGYVDGQTQSMLLDECSYEGKGQHLHGLGCDADKVVTVLQPELRYRDGSTPLHMASMFGKDRFARLLLDGRANIHAVAGSGLQPIHSASIMGHVALVELLVARQADINARHTFAESAPLHFAAEMGHHQLVQQLCQLGADVNVEKKQGGTALHIAADTNNAAVARTLVDSCGADPNAVLLGDTVPLYLAAGRGFHEVIHVLIEAGANPDKTLWTQMSWHKTRGKQQPKWGKNMPSGAARAELQRAVDRPEHLLPGSHPQAPGWEAGNGATSLHNACENGHLEAALALLDGGARQLATMEGVTPLIISLQYRHPSIASALLDHPTPANVAVADPQDGQTALHFAAMFGYPEVVARILREGGDAAAKKSARANSHRLRPRTSDQIPADSLLRPRSEVGCLIA